MANEYFKEALHNFTSDYAYGSQIRALYDRGLSAHAIKERLDYPVPYESVYDYLREYLLKSQKIVFDKKDIPANNSQPTFETEYDSYGRKSFRLKNPGSHRDISYSTVNHSGTVTDIPDLYECYAYIEAKPDKYDSVLNSKQIDYLSGLPMPGRPFYILINEPLSDILNVLNKNGLWHGPVISAKAGTEYLL